MCGICGFINLDGRQAAADIVAEMNATLIHRGPDGGAVFSHGSAALGHRRLAIVDVARGHQPMSLPGTPLTVVYNGEIYNHQQLRNSPDFPTHDYRTTSDTETLLVGYHRHGRDVLSQLRGMFTFAIYDSERQSLFLARDRLGIKPLYYYHTDRFFAFASEIKALLEHPEIRGEVNTRKLAQQLTLKYTLDDETFFRGIKKLPPGHWISVDANRVANRVTQGKYWDLSYAPKNKYASIDEAAAEFKTKFDDSVRARLMADVPLGVFLSGGIDSSVIAASMSGMTSSPIKAFSIAFGQEEYSELRYSNLVAQHVGAGVRAMVLSPEEWFEAWPHMVYHEDEPIAHPSSIPLHFVSKLAAEDVKVVLTGEGSDELLAGYERYYQTLANLRYGKYVPNRVRAVAKRLIRLLPDRFAPKRKAVRTSLYLANNIDTLFLDNYAAFRRADVHRALQPTYRDTLDIEHTYASFHELMQASDADELLDQILYADMKTYLLELLMKQDQMSMSASLESRVPFLDHELVEFVCRLPVEYKLKGFETKRILRRAFGDTIPKAIVTRSKKGFPTPIKEWFRTDFADTMRALLQSDRTLLQEYVQPAYIDQVLQRHISGAWDMQEQIWTLGNLELWLRIAIDGQDPSHVLQWEGALQCV